MGLFLRRRCSAIKKCVCNRRLFDHNVHQLFRALFSNVWISDYAYDYLPCTRHSVTETMFANDSFVWSLVVVVITFGKSTVE